jgi:glycerol-3-phosphate dehydrogenase
VIDRRRLPIPDAVVLTEGDRILFAIPWGERVILGTTDTDYDGPIASPSCDDEDVAYILDVVAVLFPEAGISGADILSFWAGLRPLVADRHGNPSDISRRHEITPGEPGWWDVTGGKLTTYRLMAEQTVDRVAGALSRQTPRCRTAEEPLLPAADTEGLSAVVPPPATERAVEHYCRNEWARHLDDVMIRRTYWHHYRADRQEIAPSVAGWMAQALGWDPATTAAELAVYLSAVREEASRFAMTQP